MDNKLESGIPAYIDQQDARIADFAEGLQEHDWQPANNVSIKFIRCLEAIRDLKLTCGFLAISADPSSDKRRIKALATPLYSLAIGIRDVHGEIQASEFQNMKKHVQKAFRKRNAAFSKEVLEGKQGRLKQVRDKIAAHIDKDTILNSNHLWADVNLAYFIRLLSRCIEELDMLLQQDFFAWTRHTETPDVIRLMNVDGTLVELSTEDDELQYISAISFVQSPRQAIGREVNDLVSTINQIVTTMKKSAQLR